MRLRPASSASSRAAGSISALRERMRSRRRASTRKYISFKRSTGRVWRFTTASCRAGFSPARATAASLAERDKAARSLRRRTPRVASSPRSTITSETAEVRSERFETTRRCSCPWVVTTVRRSSSLNAKERIRMGAETATGWAARVRTRRIGARRTSAMRPASSACTSVSISLERLVSTSSNRAICWLPWSSAERKNRSVTSRSSSRRRALEGSCARSISSWILAPERGAPEPVVGAAAAWAEALISPPGRRSARPGCGSGRWSR